MEKEGSVCFSERSDWSKDTPPYFSEEPRPSDSKKVVTSCFLDDETFSSCGHEQTQPELSSLQNHQLGLKRRFGSVSEGSEQAENITSLNRVYTELYITEGQTQGINKQHEVRQLEAQIKRKTSYDSPIRVYDIFKPLPSDHKAIRVVLTSGVAGIGKTFSVQKFILDWAKALQNQELDLVVPFFFRELNLVRERRFSLLELVQAFHPNLASQTPLVETLSQNKLLFILDGLDESRLPLDFNCEIISDITQRSEINVLLVNLIKGKLLPSALIWITSRPAATSQIPVWCVDRVTEVRGFVTKAQKEEYFRKRFTDEKLCERVLSHIKTSKSLDIMCQIPVFCWMTATVLDHMFRPGASERSLLPQTLTHMYANFLLVQTNRKKKYKESSGPELTETDCGVLLKLGRLAFEQLQKGNIMFYKDDLENVGLDETEALVYSGVCTEIFKKESVIFHQSVYCFVHLSLQEFLAAVYMHHCFSNRNMDALKSFLWENEEEEEEEEWSDEEEDDPLDLNEVLEDFLEQALSKSFQSESGHLDLLVRFLHGLCLDYNRMPLQSVLGSAWVRPDTLQKVKDHLKHMKIRYHSPDRGINVLHCLMEMNDHSVHQQIQDFLKSGDRSVKLSEIQCSALAYLLQMSEEVLEELDLDLYNASLNARLRLIPAVKNCTKARFSECMLSQPHYEVLVSALAADPSLLRELDLRESRLQDSGLETLCVGLNSPHCRLERLLVGSCALSEYSCKILAQVLKKSRLRELDLSRNMIGDEGLNWLSSALQHPQGALHTLRLTGCGLSSLCCSTLATVLVSGSGLKCLELNENDLKDSGLDLLAPVLGNPLCTLEALSMTHCMLTEQSCRSLASALSSSLLQELDMSYNQIQDSGLTLLSAGLRGSKLQTLRLRCCLLTAEGVQSLALILKETRLKEVDLSHNRLQDQAVDPLRTALQGPHCLLTLRLKDCQLSKEGCMALISAVNANKQHVTDLDLDLNQH